MNQQFKLKKETYYKELKQKFTFGSLFFLFFTSVMLGGFYFTGVDFQKLFTFEFAVFFIPFLGVTILMNAFKAWRQAKINYKSYKVIFEDDSLLLEQAVGQWDYTFISSHSISQRRLFYKEIIEIRKSKAGYYTIKCAENSYPNTLTISANLENIKAFEATLSEIKPIRFHLDATNVKEYLVDGAKVENQNKILYNKSLKILFGSYLVLLILSYFWFTPINWPLTIFLSIVYFLIILLTLPPLIKRNHHVFQIVVDDTAIIVERIKGSPVALPFNEITAVTKQDFQTTIEGKKISTSHPNRIVIPNALHDFKSLEQKLNAIHPIVYK